MKNCHLIFLRLFRLVTISIFLTATLYSPASADDLKIIQERIKESNARWRAGETEISQLPPEERAKYLGLQKSSYDSEMVEKTVSEDFITAADLPVRIDWRDVNDANWITPVKNQSSCGSCWAFAGLGVMEAMIAIQADNPTISINLSEQFVLSCSEGTCQGWTMYHTLNFLKYSGTVEECCLRYTGSDATSCFSRCSSWADQNRKIDAWSWVPNNVESIKAALNSQVVSTTMSVYTDFYYYRGGTYEHLWGDYQGGHAVVLIGYDDIEHVWIAKNSWGTSWGDKGFFKILWNEAGIGNETSILVYSNSCDSDEDGYSAVSCGGNDCDDNDYLVYPGADEICDGKDSDCDTVIPENERDDDSDGYPYCNDCDDDDPEINPGETEICGDGVDNNCSGTADDKDSDGDGYLDTGCGGSDCDDDNADTYLGAAETCDGEDNDCDGTIPDNELDEDEDSWMPCAGDCDDDRASVYPGRSDICGNFIDDDCDGYVDAQDIECNLQQWTVPATTEEAEASTQTGYPYATNTVSRVLNEGLWILLPILSVIIAKRRWRKKKP